MKSPPTYNFPSVLTTIEYTDAPTNPGTELKVLSTVPLEFNRTIRRYVLPLYNSKSPPTKILLSDCIATVRTNASKPVPTLKLLSTVPSLLKRII